MRLICLVVFVLLCAIFSSRIVRVLGNGGLCCVQLAEGNISVVLLGDYFTSGVLLCAISWVNLQ